MLPDRESGVLTACSKNWLLASRTLTPYLVTLDPLLLMRRIHRYSARRSVYTFLSASSRLVTASTPAKMPMIARHRLDEKYQKLWKCSCFKRFTKSSAYVKRLLAACRVIKKSSVRGPEDACDRRMARWMVISAVKYARCR